MSAPTECPFGTGEPFTITVFKDVRTVHGNVSVPAGVYTAWKAESMYPGDNRDGVVMVWSEKHYAGPMWTSLTSWLWAYPGEQPRPQPEHVCVDEAKSGVAGGVFCAICHKRLIA